MLKVGLFQRGRIGCGGERLRRCRPATGGGCETVNGSSEERGEVQWCSGGGRGGGEVRLGGWEGDERWWVDRCGHLARSARMKRI